MVIAESENEFRAFLSRHGKTPESLVPEEMLMLGFEFFEKVRAADTLPLNNEEFGDALLFQWGVREALSGYYESCFYFDLTRQFISVEGEDDDAMFQLSCQLQYDPTDELRTIGDGNRWCGSLDEFAEFMQFALSHPATQALRGRVPVKAEQFFTGI